MNWATFLSALRQDLKDTGATPRWSDELLHTYTVDAVADYSRWLPRRIDRVTLTLTGGVYPLPSDFIRVIAVESPIDAVIEEGDIVPGRRRSRNAYMLSGGNLYFVQVPASDVLLTYYALHPSPANKDDTAFVFTVPAVDLELLRLYIKGKCYEHLRSRTASLDRFKLGGSRDDNPITPEVDDLLGEYRRKIAERMPGGSITLYRRGRIR